MFPLSLAVFNSETGKGRRNIDTLCSLARLFCCSANRRKTILTLKPQMSSKAQLSSNARNCMQFMCLRRYSQASIGDSCKYPQIFCHGITLKMTLVCSTQKTNWNVLSHFSGKTAALCGFVSITNWLWMWFTERLRWFSFPPCLPEVTGSGHHTDPLSYTPRLYCSRCSSTLVHLSVHRQGWDW